MTLTQPVITVTMFEEDFERCFICQQPCRGLYCSSECRLQDKGTPSPAVKPGPTPVRLTSQLPISLSPMVRPTHQIAPSPMMPAHLPRGDSSSSSSITSSPLQSPRTNPSASDSPQKDVFNLPPPAFPPVQIGFPGSVPVKIPNLVTRPPISQPIPSHGTLYPTGASIDTLRFGRKPSVTNSVTSPNALRPKCACGKPANHQNRASSKERDFEAGFSSLALGSPRVKPLDDRSNRIHDNRIVSDPTIPPFKDRRLSHNHLKSISSHGTAAPSPLNIGNQYQTISSVIGGGASLLSRSRSDPIPPYAKNRNLPPAAQMSIVNPVASTSRRASAGQGNDASHIRFTGIASPNAGAPASLASGSMLPPLPPPLVSQTTNARRGRSRERHDHNQDDSSSSSGFALQGLLGERSRSGSKKREEGPSRSRHRREERDNERRRVEQLDSSATRGRDRGSPVQQQQAVVQEHAPITPSWSRQNSGITGTPSPDHHDHHHQNHQPKHLHNHRHGAVAPSMRRTGSGSSNETHPRKQNGLPHAVVSDGNANVKANGNGTGNNGDEKNRERRAEEVRKASKTLDQMFGVAAG